MATISSWSERMISHTGTEIRPRLLREAAEGEFSAMGESLTEQYRVRDEGPWVVNLFFQAMGESLTQQRRVIEEGLRFVKICHKGRIASILTQYWSDGTL